VLCLAATLYWVQARRGLTVLVGAAPIVLMVAAIGISYFRAAWLAAFVVAIAAFGLRPKRFGRVLTLVGLLAVLAAVASTQVEGRGESAVSTRLSDTENISGRLATYRFELDLFAQSPWTGVGVNKFTDVAKSSPAINVAGVEALQYPHSSYLGTLVEHGLLGFLPLMAVTFAVWWLLRAFRGRARERADILLLACVGGAAVGYVLMSLTLTLIPYGTSNALLMVLLGAVAARLDVLDAEPLTEAG
jgi:O-antigen ligase